MAYRSCLDQVIAFFDAFGVTIIGEREIASDWLYFVPLASSLEYEEEEGRWVHNQQLERIARGFGFVEQRYH